jgi:glycosyltransferase involved in cell wall biosynthesis
VKKSIFYISKYFAVPQSSGSARAYWLTKNLSEHHGHDVTVLTASFAHFDKFDQTKLLKEFCSETFEIRPLKSLKYQNSRSFKRALSWLLFEFSVIRDCLSNKKKPNLIIASSPSMFTFVTGYLLSLRYKCKLIIEVRDIWPLTIANYQILGDKNLVVKALSIIESFAYRKADAVIGTMPNLISHVQQVSERSEGIYCVPQGCSKDLMRITGQQKDSYSPELRYLEDKFVVAYSGSIGGSNSLNTFFEAAESLTNRKDLHFLIVGDGALKVSLMERYAKLDNISFIPRMDQEDLHEFLPNCDLLYFGCNDGQIWEFGQSLNKIIDYMLAGRPILGSYSGFPTMINEADCGIYVPALDSSAVANAIEYLSSLSDETLHEMGARGRDWVTKNRNYDTLTDQYNEIIINL